MGLFIFFVDFLACIGLCFVAAILVLKLLGWICDILNDGRPRPDVPTFPGERVIFSTLPLTITARAWEYPQWPPSTPPGQRHQGSSTTTLPSQPQHPPSHPPTYPSPGSSPPASPPSPAVCSNLMMNTVPWGQEWRPLTAYSPLRDPIEFNSRPSYWLNPDNGSLNQVRLGQQHTTAFDRYWAPTLAANEIDHIYRRQSFNRCTETSPKRQYPTTIPVITKQPSKQSTFASNWGLFEPLEKNVIEPSLKQSNPKIEQQRSQSQLPSAVLQTRLHELIQRPTRQGFQVQQEKSFSFAPVSSPVNVVNRRRSNFYGFQD